MEEKNQELAERIKNGTLQKTLDKSLKIELFNINSYANKTLPNIDKHKIHVDNDHNTVLVPFQD